VSVIITVAGVTPAEIKRLATLRPGIAGRASRGTKPVGSQSRF